MCLLILRKLLILLMHSVPHCQWHLAEQIGTDTGMKTKHQIQEIFGLTCLIDICESTSNVIHKIFSSREHKRPGSHVGNTHSGHRSGEVLPVRFISIPTLTHVSKLHSAGLPHSQKFQRDPRF